MTKKIFRSISLVALALLFLSIVLIMGVLYDYYTGQQIKNLELQTELVANAVELEGGNYLSSVKTDACRITWIDPEGSVRFDTRASSETMENHLEREEVREALTVGNGSSRRYSTTLMERSFYAARRLSDGSVIRLSVSQLTWWALLISVIQPIAIVLLLTLGLSFFLAYRVAHRVVEPLNAIDLDHPDRTEVYEEISPLLQRIRAQQAQIHAQKAELTKKKNEFAAATENMSEGIVLCNADGLVLSVNKAASRLLGISNYCVGKDLLLFRNGEALRELLQRAASGVHSEEAIPLRGADYRFYASPVFTENTVTGIALIILDITEKEKAERSRREFTANVSHELKTPLQNIAGSAELLEAGLVKPQDVQEFAGRILRESRRLFTLVEDIMKLSRLDEDAEEIPTSEVALREMANRVAEELKPEAEAASVTVEVRGEAGVFQGKAPLVYSILHNLCENAIKYNVAGGTVTLCVSEWADRVKLTVSDTGIGIPEEEQGRIFERFYRVDKSRSKAVGGTGLGLSIVKHAAMLHNAEVEVSSTPGKGSVFSVTFPK